MKLSEALNKIEKLYNWKLSKEQKKIFVDMMRLTKNPQQIIDNWAIYHHDNPRRSPKWFKVWFYKNVNVEETEKQTEFPSMKWEDK